MARHPLDESTNIVLNIVSPDGVGQFSGEPAQLGLFFHDHHLETLVCHAEGSTHAGDSTANDQGPFIDGNPFRLEGL